MISMKDTLFPCTNNEEIASRIKAALERLNTPDIKRAAAVIISQWFDEDEPVKVNTGHPMLDEFGVCAIVDALMISASILALKEKEL